MEWKGNYFDFLRQLKSKWFKKTSSYPNGHGIKFPNSESPKSIKQKKFANHSQLEVISFCCWTNLFSFLLEKSDFS
jgi:hypothetical protein